jgi:hypothetical protein
MSFTLVKNNKRAVKDDGAPICKEATQMHQGVRKHDELSQESQLNASLALLY